MSNVETCRYIETFVYSRKTRQFTYGMLKYTRDYLSSIIWIQEIELEN